LYRRQLLLVPPDLLANLGQRDSTRRIRRFDSESEGSPGVRPMLEDLNLFGSSQYDDVIEAPLHRRQLLLIPTNLLANLDQSDSQHGSKIQPVTQKIRRKIRALHEDSE
jgi:hypothetical protein